jgi:ribosome recycling factor
MDLEDVRVKMQKALEFVRQDVGAIRTGRATPALVENVIINAYGGSAKLKIVELATISVADPQCLTISPYDPSIIGDIRRDLANANLGLTPVIDNNVIRVPVPALTSERRFEYVKMLHRKLEEGRVKIRQIRHDRMSELKREFESKEVNEDDKDRVEEELQKLTDKMMEEIENVGEAKEKEIVAE